MNSEIFENAYRGQPPWDIHEPQPEIVRLAEEGTIQGQVLDVGCGTGENALFLAARGHDVWGVDFIPKAIEAAREKARMRGLDVHFQLADALQLEVLGRDFDTVIDCGLFHTFSDMERALYVRALARATRPGGTVILLCFSDQEPPGSGPRRITRTELFESFQDGWAIDAVRETRFKTSEAPETSQFSPGGPFAWSVTVRRAPAPVPDGGAPGS